MNRISFLFFAASTSILIYGCKGESSETPAHSEPSKDSIATDSLSDTDFSTFVNDTALIFIPGMMHGEEVPKKAETLNWMALVVEKDCSFSIKKVELMAQQVYDPIIDGEDESVKTGISFSCDSSINALYFLSIPLVEQSGLTGKIIPAGDYFFPGNSHAFQQNGKTYKLSATGEAVDNDGNPTENREAMRGYKNYRIRFEGPGIQQELLFKKEDYESTPQPLFIGDLNKDGIPDLIMDTESHYNFTGLALFLSENGKLRLVAYHVTSGC